MKVTVQFNARLPVKFTKKSKWHVASCPILDVHSQGETKGKAKKNLEEALSLFFISCFERGVLDAVLKDCGFRAFRPEVNQKPHGPKTSREEYLNIPIPFTVDQSSLTACHA